MPARDGSIRYFTNSEIQAFKRCRRKWFLAYWLKLAPTVEQVTGVRSLGTRIHRALAAYYTTPDRARNPLEILEDDYQHDRRALLETGDLVTVENLDKDIEYARVMVEGYLEWVAEEGVDIGLRIVDSEKEVSAPLQITHQGRPVHLLGRLDVQVARELDGARLFLDHKNVGSFSQATAMLHMDEQMQTYTLIQILEQVARGIPAEERVRCDGGIYNMLRRVKRTARARPPFYARETVQFNDTQLRNFYRHVHAVIQEICAIETRLAAVENGGAPNPAVRVGDVHHDLCPPFPRADCAWSCDYRHLCPMMDDDRSNAEKFALDHFRAYDPLDRYADKESDLHEGDGE